MLSRKAFVLLFLMCYSKPLVKKSPLNCQVFLSYHLLCLPSDIPVSASSTGLPTVKKHTSSPPRKETLSSDVQTPAFISMSQATQSQETRTAGHFCWNDRRLSFPRRKLRHAAAAIGRAKNKPNRTRRLSCETRTPNSLCARGVQVLSYRHTTTTTTSEHVTQTCFLPPQCCRHRLVRIRIDVFFLSLYDKQEEKQKKALLIKTAVYSMMDVSI